jgi:hypothetical protein
VDSKPVLNTDSKAKPSDAGSDVMVVIQFKCTVDGCSFETDELEPTLAAKLLRIHSEANHIVRVAVDHETSYRSWTAQS